MPVQRPCMDYKGVSQKLAHLAESCISKSAGTAEGFAGLTSLPELWPETNPFSGKKGEDGAIGTSNSWERCAQMLSAETVSLTSHQMVTRKGKLFALDFLHGVQSAVHPVTPSQLKPCCWHGEMHMVGGKSGRLDGVKHMGWCSVSPAKRRSG